MSCPLTKFWLSNRNSLIMYILYIVDWWVRSWSDVLVRGPWAFQYLHSSSTCIIYTAYYRSSICIVWWWRDDFGINTWGMLVDLVSKETASIHCHNFMLSQEEVSKLLVAIMRNSVLQKWESPSGQDEYCVGISIHQHLYLWSLWINRIFTIHNLYFNNTMGCCAHAT